MLMECRKCGRKFSPYIAGQQLPGVAIHSSICRKCRKKKKEKEKIKDETKENNSH